MRSVQELKKTSIHKCSICGKEYKKRIIDLSFLGKVNKEVIEPICTCEEELRHKKEMKEYNKNKGKKIISQINSIKNCIGKRFQGKTFTNFDKTKNKTAYDICFDYARNIEVRLNDGQGLFLTGNVGTGKTHLAVAIVDYIARLKKRGRNWNIAYITAVDLLAKIKMGFNNNQAENIVSYYEESDLLIIDDLGVEKISDWVHEIFYKIIDHRYNEMKPLIIMSNLSDEEIKAKLGERIISRIYEMCKGTKFYGKDYRVFK